MSDSRPAAVSRCTESNDHVLRNEIYELIKESKSLREALSSEIDENDRLREQLVLALEITAEQAVDEGLWCPAVTATEAYLQQELRRLHAAVEGER